MTFAVTGANGFLGVHIIHHLLLKGHKVIAIIRPESSLDDFNLIKKKYGFNIEKYENLQWKYCELYDSNELLSIFSRVDYVYHLAGIISYYKSDFDKLLEINKSYTANVANMALEARVKKIVYCSSIAALSKDGEGELVDENNIWDDKKPHSNYGLSKYLGECEIWRIQEEGLQVAIVNPGIILGFGNWNKGSNTLFKNAFNEFYFYSKGVTGFIGVEDVANAMYEISVSNNTGERYILCSEDLSFQDVSNQMAVGFQKKRPKVEVQGLLYNLIYFLVAIKEFFGIKGLLTKETVKSSVSKSYFSNEKMMRHYNFKFTPIKDVIEEATYWYKKSPRKNESF